MSSVSYGNYIELCSSLGRPANITADGWERFDPVDRTTFLEDMRADLREQLRQRRLTRRLKDAPATQPELVW